MRKLFVVLAVLSLNGCAVWDAYFMTGFDPNEYRVITEIRADAYNYKNSCSNKALSEVNAVALADKTQLFEFYEEQIPKNKNGINASKELNKIAQGLKTSYASGNPVNPIFCKLKMESIEHSAQTIQHVLGQRPR
jgi:hypothetical protein